MKEIAVLDARRSPIGSFLGNLSDFQAQELASQVIAEMNITKYGVLDEALIGCVVQAGLGQSPARQAVLGAGLNIDIPCTTLNKVCGSGMKAVMQLCDTIRCGDNQLVLAGGMESMSNAPHAVYGTRTGIKFGDATFVDLMNRDGLEDALVRKSDGARFLMGEFAEKLANKEGLTRTMQEDFAKSCYEKTLAAQNYYKHEIIPIKKTDKKGNEVVIEADEHFKRVSPEKFSKLRPAFAQEGTITAATSSALGDGAAMMVLSSIEYAQRIQIEPMARIVGYAQHAHAPEWFTTAPIGAIEKLLQKLSWDISDVDLFEINEAFAVVPMAACKALSIPYEKVNVFGGACSMGHPIGMSGTRIVVTLINALITMNKKRGIAAICIGSGEGLAIAVEI